MGLSWQHLLIFLVIALLLFGRGKISSLMGDVAQGIKAFKKGMAEDDTAKTETPPAAPAAIEGTAQKPVAPAQTTETKA